jgi:hypothetical protein
VTRLIQSGQGLEPSKVLLGSLTHNVDFWAHKFELMSKLVGDGSVVDRHDRLLPRSLSAFFPMERAPEVMKFFYHGALFELVFDRVRMVWIGRFENLLEVLARLPRLVLKVMLNYRDILLI